MIRKNENPVALKAGIFAIGMHVLLFAGMLFSFNWKAAHPVSVVTEVELWDKLPSTQPAPVVQPPPPVVEELPKPIVEEPPKVEVEQPKPIEPKVDIELENKKKELEKKELEQKIKLEKLAELKKQKELDKKKKLEALQAASREDDLEVKAADKNGDAIKKLQQDVLSDENAANEKQASAANASVVGEFKSKIQAKIRGNVNKTLCAEGNPELRFEINLLPTGELSGSPKITKSSGNAACDDAVERAIIASEPLPLPSDPSLFSNFRNLSLKFRPND